MYFCNHKTYKHETEQHILLEMCNNACFRFRNGQGFSGITHLHIFSLKVAGTIVSATFLFNLLV